MFGLGAGGGGKRPAGAGKEEIFHVNCHTSWGKRERGWAGEEAASIVRMEASASLGKSRDVVDSGDEEGEGIAPLREGRVRRRSRSPDAWRCESHWNASRARHDQRSHGECMRTAEGSMPLSSCAILVSDAEVASGALAALFTF